MPYWINAFFFVLKVIILVWSLIPFGSAFQVLGADALNDLSPNVALYRQVGSSRISPLDTDRREYLLFPLIDSRLFKYCGVLKWIALKVNNPILYWILYSTGSQCNLNPSFPTSHILSTPFHPRLITCVPGPLIINPSTVFLTFDKDQLAKIHQHR